MADSVHSYNTSSTSAGSVKRRRMGCNKAFEQLEGFAEAVKIQGHRLTLDKVNQHLQQDSVLTTLVLHLIESGKLQQKKDMAGFLPASTNKFKLLKVERKLMLCKVVAPSIFNDEAQVKCMRKKDKAIFDKFLQCALAIDMQCAVFSREISILAQMCKDRSMELGNDFTKAQVQNGVVDFGAIGVFALVADEASGRVTHVVHKATKQQASLEDIGVAVDASWDIGCNWDTSKAILKKGKITMKLLSLFPRGVHEALKPMNLARVPATVRAPSLTSTQASPEASPAAGAAEVAGLALDAQAQPQHDAAPAPPLGHGGALQQ
jgi:hypothetical protein